MLKDIKDNNINFTTTESNRQDRERSKREDLEDRCPEWGNCRTLKYDPRMRCSEHCGNTVRETE